MQEAQHTEFKREWRDEWLKWISGFANANGGTLLVGVDDKGTAVGLANAKKLLEDLPNKVRDVLGILVDVNLIARDEQQVLEINVPASPNAISYKGEFYYRGGSTNQELKGSSLQHFLLKKHGMHWDAVTLEKPSLDSLNSEEIARFKRMAVNSNRLDEDALAYTDKEILEKLLLIEGDELKHAAVLLFHHQPERYISNAFVRVGLFGR